MNLDDLDLNLLRVFNQLMLERRVSAVARSLHLSQPAVSNALRRLRRLLKDELFLRTAQGMQPTPLAEQLAEPVALALGTIKTALLRQVTFDPTTAQREFTLGLSDVGEMYFLPTLVARLAQEAPGVSLNSRRKNSQSAKDDMESGRIDLAVGLLPNLQSGFYRQRLFMQGYVWVFRNGHPLSKGTQPPGLEEFREAQHVLTTEPRTGDGEVDRLIERQGIERKVRLSVPHYIAVGHILQATDLVATMPSRLAERLVEPFGLRYVPHPVKLPELSIEMFWHARLHRDPGNQWLRRLIFELFAD